MDASEEPDLGEIRAFIAVAEAGSFAGATRAARLSRSALGKSIMRLERRLGTRLLHRTTRQVSLTADGAAYLRRMRCILADLAEAEANVRRDQAVPRGTLRLSMPTAYGRLCILPVLATFLRRWPALTADVSFTDHPVNLVEEGIDLAIRIASTENGAETVGRVVARTEAFLCAAPAYLAERGLPEDAQALDGHDRLVFRGAGRTMSWGEGMPNDARQSRLVVDSADALHAMAVAGLGIAELPAFLVADDLAAGRLAPVLPDQRRPVLISLLYATARHQPTRVRLFIDHLIQSLAGSDHRAEDTRSPKGETPPSSAPAQPAT